MALLRTYRWARGDQIWFVCARLLAEAGYDSVSAFVDATRTANPSVLDWSAVEAGTIITIPYLAP